MEKKSKRRRVVGVELEWLKNKHRKMQVELWTNNPDEYAKAKKASEARQKALAKLTIKLDSLDKLSMLLPKPSECIGKKYTVFGKTKVIVSVTEAEYVINAGFNIF